MASRLAVVGLLLALCAATALATEDTGRKLLQSRLSPVQPRLDLHEITAMSEMDPYRIMMLMAWRQLTTSPRRNTPFSYWQLAGVHGKDWSYNGVDAPTSGFCRHQVPGFGPWHRAYLRQFELALLDSAKVAASAFTDEALRTQFTAVAEAIRLPYYDWTNPRVPDILTASRVTVLDTETGQPTQIRNPLGAYEYTAAAGDGRGPGRRSLRGSTWAETMSRSARRFGMEMASFLRSNTWRCTYLTGIGCTGNLESTHNEIHNILGGNQGEMATVLYAGFDPVFWLHHCMVDRVLWLFQNNGGQWMGAHAYSPFLNLQGDAAEISSYGYAYSPGRPIGGGFEGPRDGPRRGRRGGAWLASTTPTETPETVANDATNNPVVIKVGSAAGKAAVRTAIQQWTGNYTGYTWSVRFQELEQHQMEEPVHLLVYLKTASDGSSNVLAIPAKVDELNELRMKPNYCGSIAGFNEQVHVHSEEGSKTISRAVDLTNCLKEASINPNVPAVNPEDFSRGPAKVPIKLADLKIVAVTADGRDVTDSYNFGKTVISWSVPVTRSAAEVRAAAAADPIEAQAFAHPLAFGAEQQLFSMVVGDTATA